VEVELLAELVAIHVEVVVAQVFMVKVPAVLFMVVVVLGVLLHRVQLEEVMVAEQEVVVNPVPAPFVLCGPELHANSHQLMLAHHKY
jgi:hypothetical protein